MKNLIFLLLLSGCVNAPPTIEQSAFRHAFTGCISKWDQLNVKRSVRPEGRDAYDYCFQIANEAVR